MSVTVEGRTVNTGERNVKAANKSTRIKERWFNLQSGKCILCAGDMVRTANGVIDATWEHLWTSAARAGVEVDGDTRPYAEGLIFLAHGVCNSDVTTANLEAATRVDYALALLARAGLCG